MSAATAWMDGALCAGADPEIFFRRGDRAKALEMCAACPVSEACRAAGAGEYRGVWAGEVHNSSAVGPSPSADYIGYQHGTNAGYSRHLRDGTPPCGSCSVAHTYGNREWAERNPRVRTDEELARQRERRQQKAEPIRRQRSRVGAS